jgi:hypothetical protein
MLSNPIAERNTLLKTLPTLDVKQILMSSEDLERITEEICLDIMTLPLEEMRYTMKAGKLPPLSGPRTEGRRRERTHPPRHFGELRIGLLKDPLGLGFFGRATCEYPEGPLGVGFARAMSKYPVVVRLSPEDFDRSQPQQEELYQKCLEIIAIHRDSRVQKPRVWNEPLCTASFTFQRSLTQEESNNWRLLWDLWNAPR